MVPLSQLGPSAKGPEQAEAGKKPGCRARFLPPFISALHVIKALRVPPGLLGTAPPHPALPEETLSFRRAGPCGEAGGDSLLQPAMLLPSFGFAAFFIYKDPGHPG